MARQVAPLGPLFENAPPSPRFDRLVCRDSGWLSHVPKSEVTIDKYGVPMAALGLPVFFDPDVAPGVIELRKGDQVVMAIRLPGALDS